MGAGILCGPTFPEQPKSVEALFFPKAIQKNAKSDTRGHIRPDISN